MDHVKIRMETIFVHVTVVGVGRTVASMSMNAKASFVCTGGNVPIL
jgi:hypothetical protein